MKNILKDNTRLLLTLCGIIIWLTSCEYETKVRDAVYPDQKIYMPAAYGGYYVIDDIARRIGDPPVPGSTSRYVVDLTGRRFNVPLGVYRGGVNNKGSFMVNIAVDNDTINKLIAAGKLVNTVLLGSDKYTIVSSVEMPDGEEIAQFNLSISLDSMRNNYPGKIFALGVGIASTERATNPNLATTIVVVHTKIMKPTAGYTYAVDATDNKKINFTNTSLYAVSYSWNFGDGSDASVDMSPSHTYAAAGTYNVILTATGITGDEDKATFTASITIP